MSKRPPEPHACMGKSTGWDTQNDATDYKIEASQELATALCSTFQTTENRTALDCRAISPRQFTIVEDILDIADSSVMLLLLLYSAQYGIQYTMNEATLHDCGCNQSDRTLFCNYHVMQLHRRCTVILLCNTIRTECSCSHFTCSCVTAMLPYVT